MTTANMWEFLFIYFAVDRLQDGGSVGKFFPSSREGFNPRQGPSGIHVFMPSRRHQINAACVFPGHTKQLHSKVK